LGNPLKRVTTNNERRSATFGGCAVLVFQGESAANELCFTSDGAHLLAARAGGEVDAWELATGKRTQLLGPRNLEEVSQLEPPRVSLCASGFALRMRSYGPIEFAHIDGRTGSVDPRDVQSAVLAPDGADLVANVHYNGTNWFNGYALCTEGEFSLARQWSVPRGLRENAFAAFGPARFVTYSESHIYVRSAATGALELAVPYKSNYIRAFAVSPDAARFASMGWDRLYLFDATAWAKPTVVTGFSVPIYSMAYHPTRPMLATVQSRQTLVKYLDANTGKAIKKFAWKLGSMRAVAFSPDGALAAASAADGRIVVWDADA
jgi:WD40 repeat protein